jgi:predicted glycogen debranching enzyme
MIILEADICRDLSESSSREWLETNGIGGFACGTVSGANTRRYHGILTAAADAPLGRLRCVSRVEETLLIDGRRYDLSTNHFPNAVFPKGYSYIKQFRLDPYPIWTFEVEGIRVERSFFMAHGENTTVCRWKTILAVSGTEVSLEVRPLMSCVDYHHLRHENDGLNIESKFDKGIAEISSNAQTPDIYFAHNAIASETTGLWYRNFEYEIEKERGFDFHEDLFQPFSLRFGLGHPAAIVISTQKRAVSDADALEKREVRRRNKLIAMSPSNDAMTHQLTLAADQFIVKRGSGETVIAGYPWFTDWGRDTMIALPGLTLAANRPKIAKGILLEFSKHISRGMLPNRFADADGEAEYNTVDATLWYFEAVRALLEKTDEYDFVHVNLYKKLADIIAWHVRGTRFGIHVDDDGLLFAGDHSVQLTWMDAKIGDHVITPRTGKAVEIQALWYNALMIMASLAERFGDKEDESRYLAMAGRCSVSFNALFWNEAEECLFDVVNGEARDASVRPNQIFAVSLHFSMLDDEKARKIVDKAAADLLTPFGLRSLSPSDPAFVPVYEGSPLDRDSAYHQGTVWAWLIGSFADAYRRVYPADTDRIRQLLEPFRAHLLHAGLGQISEIFDATSPFRPRGCFAQAWSVAEVLRLAVSQDM